MAEPKRYVLEDGTNRWFLNGWLHRTNGPAVIHPDGTKYWYLNGNRHRSDGPAIIWTDGQMSWYLNGRKYESFEDWLTALDVCDEDRTWFKLMWGGHG